MSKVTVVMHDSHCHAGKTSYWCCMRYFKYIFLNVKKDHFLTLKKSCSIGFLENKELKGSNRYLHLCEY